MSNSSALLNKRREFETAEPIRNGAQLRVLMRALDVEYTEDSKTVWASVARTAPPYVTPQLIAEMGHLSAQIRAGAYGALRHRVISSRKNNCFSLGGDLQLFLSLISVGDRDGLFTYGKAAIDEVWSSVTGCGLKDLVTIALVNGEAQGGGFEAALACHVLVAEEGCHFGFPEALFGLFPGMGGLPLISRRCGHDVAKRMMQKSNRYTAEFLHEIGIVDYLVRTGTGIEFVKELVRANTIPCFALRQQQLRSLSYSQLLESVDEWVTCAMTLSGKHQRSMRYFVEAQRHAFQIA